MTRLGHVVTAAARENLRRLGAPEGAAFGSFGGLGGGGSMMTMGIGYQPRRTLSKRHTRPWASAIKFEKPRPEGIAAICVMNSRFSRTTTMGLSVAVSMPRTLP